MRGAGPPGPSAGISAAEFRAATEQRLRTLEREVAEVNGRVNGLIFVVAAAGDHAGHPQSCAVASEASGIP